MRFAHLKGAERPLAVVDGDRVAALDLDGIGTVDELIAPGMLDAPLRAPSKIACVGLNYHDHCRETGMAVPDRPLIFAKFPSALTGPDAAIEVPAGLTEQVDWEVELAAVIGRRTRHASPDVALD